MGPAWQNGVAKQALKTVCHLDPKSEAVVLNESGTDFDLRLTW